MSVLKDIGQKVRGKVQEVEGEIDQRTGRPLSGAVKKIKGKYNNISADLKMDLKKEKMRRRAL